SHPTLLLPLSANRPAALRELAAGYLPLLDDEGEGAPRLLDLCHSAATRREHREARLAAVADSRAGMARALRDHLGGVPTKAVRTADDVPSRSPEVVFVFPGQGGQWAGMGRELLATEPEFAAAMAECDEAIRAETGWSVVELLNGGEDRFGELDVVQPALWAVEVSLARLWRSWGVRPAAVVGHSMGEAAAAAFSGALSIADAAAVVCRRSRIAKKLSGRGAMGWVELPEEQARQALAAVADRVSVAACNSPRSTVVSGDAEAVDGVLADLEAAGVFCSRINVDFASHSPQIDEISEELIAALDGLAPCAGSVPVVSTVTGETVDGSGMNAAYWAENIRRPVLFEGAIRSAPGGSDTVFIEVGPHPVLVPSINETLEEAGEDGVAVASLRRDEHERARLLDAVSALYTCGVHVDWDALLGRGSFVSLPAYPWQRESYWTRAVAPAPAAAPSSPAAAGPEQPP
ncbi:acyltransferase domain-containing protein, partial [Streptomonospora algeriensis]